MNKEQQNIYARARAASGLSQEAAAEALELSTRSVADYEAGRVVPNRGTVRTMVETYSTPWLAYEHLYAETQPLDVLPPIRVQELPTATITLRNRLKGAATRLDELLEIAEDGDVDETERLAFECIRAELLSVIAAVYQVIFAKSAKKERPEAATSKRSVVSRGIKRTSTKNIITGSRELSRGNFERAVAR